MRTEVIFPSLMAALSFISSIMYGLSGDVRRMLYWLSAGIITLVVTF